MVRKRELFAATSAFLLSAAMIPNAMAQEEGTVIEEITVTAQKREQSLQDVPISIFATSGATLEAMGSRDISALGELTPNVTIDSAITGAGSSAVTSIYIRGIGQSDFLVTNDPGVGLYLDGVYISRSVGSLLNVADIERFEVLRGPQGTLYGKNTIGGAINVITKKPTEQQSFSAKATLGSDNRFDGIITASIPFSDNFFTKFTLASFNQDGYMKRPFEGDKLGDKDTLAGRASFLYLPSDHVDISLTADFTRSREQATPSSWFRSGGNLRRPIPPPP